MSIHGLVFQRASTIQIQLRVLVLYKADLILTTLKINLFSTWYSWKIRVGVKQQSLTHALDILWHIVVINVPGVFSVQDKVGFTYINTGDLNYLAAYTTVKFDKKITDIHGDYNPATGIFTAPVAGFFAFALDTRALPGKHCWVEVWRMDIQLPIIIWKHQVARRIVRHHLLLFI